MNQNDICQERHRSNSESTAANPSSVVKQRDRRRVYELLKHNEKYWPGEGSTSKEIASKMGRKLHCISGRISELKQAGLVIVKGRRDACGILHLTHQNEQLELAY